MAAGQRMSLEFGNMSQSSKNRPPGRPQVGNGRRVRGGFENFQLCSRGRRPGRPEPTMDVSQGQRQPL